MDNNQVVGKPLHVTIGEWFDQALNDDQPYAACMLLMILQGSKLPAKAAQEVVAVLESPKIAKKIENVITVLTADGEEKDDGYELEAELAKTIVDLRGRS
ncbi:MAG: hypothetical protein G01um101430_645 [Parcubacteria group bacterium Gr01-1014_30]|nr:MAG: hypothetical protein G01um101430_645 [Parcubacteria group bacterium Gr01-1014_30]